MILAEFQVSMSDPAPISINAAYSGREKRWLTKEGKKFKDALRRVVAEATHATGKWETVVDACYKQLVTVDVVITVFFADLYVSPGSYTASKTLRTPYKKKDASNYLKLIEDAIASGTGIDDSFHMSVTIIKGMDATNPRVEVVYVVYGEQDNRTGQSDQRCD